MTLKISIIAESAANHNGDYENLVSLANAAIGADYFTFQIVNENYFCDKDFIK